MRINEYSPDGKLVAEHFSVTEENLETWYPRIKGIRWNFVLGADYSTSENSNTVSNSLDRSILKFIRRQSDLIITTGKTARAEALKASSFAPMLIITSDESLDVPAIATNSAQRVYVLGVDSLHNAKNENLHVLGRFSGSVADEVEQLSTRFESIVLEAGRTVTSELMDRNLVTEIDITVTGANGLLDAKDILKNGVGKFAKDFQIVQILGDGETWFFKGLANQ
jgi:riboflavin biosynthesis pyrimidine reductase